VNPILAQRELSLAAVALLAIVIALAVAGRGSSSDEQTAAPQPLPGEWHEALAGPRAPGGYGRKTACGGVLRRETVGLSHPVLPCGAKLFVAFGDRKVLTQVVDRGPTVPGRDFELTAALASELDVHDVRRVRWTFARTTRAP
jgi:hypothetical protein